MTHAYSEVTMSLRRTHLRLGLFALAATAAVAMPHAEACIGFYMPQIPRQPSLSHEQVLIAYDQDKQTEHFVRQVAFRESAPFAFVVPTPSLPTVQKEESPFPALTKEFPFATQEGIGLGGLGSIGHGSGFGARGVNVLETKVVGSFTAFVLATTDAKALHTWLQENGFSSRATAEPWIAHYVKAHFYFVAMRYNEPPPPPLGGMRISTVKAETIRISFATAVPFYPYLEPSEPAKGGRALELWFAAKERYVPLAHKAGVGVVQPMRAGNSYATSSDAATFHGNPNNPNPSAVRTGRLSELPSSIRGIVPEGFLDTFQDQKSSRIGFGDIVFVPHDTRTLTDRQKSEIAPWLTVLQPSTDGSVSMPNAKTDGGVADGGTP